MGAHPPNRQWGLAQGHPGHPSEDRTQKYLKLWIFSPKVTASQSVIKPDFRASATSLYMCCALFAVLCGKIF